MKTPAGKPLSFVYISRPEHKRRLCWTARLDFKGGDGEDSVLDIEILDGEGDAVESASFTLAGKFLPVENGRARISYRDFIAGKHERLVMLKRAGMPPVQGWLTFA